MSRHALLIAQGDYEDALLGQLRAPNQDVERLAAVLEDPDVGEFDQVTIVSNAPAQEMRMAIEEALADRCSDDLVLVYLSCHGIVDRLRRLHFAAVDTRCTRPGGTAVSASYLNEQFESCSAAAKVLVLDCCFSGAYAEGFKSTGDVALDRQVGSGYVVLSASDAFEYAYEADSVVESAPKASIFTDALIEGLATGAADLDFDGRIGADEWFRYAHDSVIKRRPEQKPKLSSHNAEPHIYLAKSRLGRTAMAPDAPVASPLPVNNYNRHQIVVARGYRSMADLVAQTLGPLGRRILVEDATGAYHEATDASTIALHFRAVDPRDAIGVGYGKEVVRRVHQEAADGAATAVVIGRALIDGVTAALREGGNAMALRRSIQAHAATAAGEIDRIARDVESKEQLANICAVAAGDRLLGELIAEAMDKVGTEGAIAIERSRTQAAELVLTEGITVSGGFASPLFETSVEHGIAELVDPYILVFPGVISSSDEICPLLDRVAPTGRPLVVVARSVEKSALATLITNKLRGILPSVAVNLAPDTTDDEVADLALIAGAFVLFDQTGVSLADVRPDMLGHARKVAISEFGTTVVDGAGDGDGIMARVNAIRARIEATDDRALRDALVRRLANLAGGVATIRLGAASDEEYATRKADLERAITASRRAVDAGYVRGGGMCLVDVAERLQQSRSDGALLIVTQALREPALQILRNSGYPADALPGNGRVFDVVRGELDDDAILDSAAAQKTAVLTAADVVARFLTIA